MVTVKIKNNLLNIIPVYVQNITKRNEEKDIYEICKTF